MLSDRTFAALGLASLVAIGLVATPAVSAISGSAIDRASALSVLAGRFTPATGDPRLLQRYAGLSAEARSHFRFTPAMTRSENRALTLVVRATPVVDDIIVTAARPAAPIAIAPLTYRLGSAVGYTAFAAPTPLVRESVDIAALPSVHRPVEAAARPSRFGADMRLDGHASQVVTERAIDPDRAYSLDVTGKYRLSHNLDVTAGVRLRRENDRLAPLTDQRQDSQAVYVGTRFRF